MEEESEELYETAQVLLDQETGNFTDEVSELLDYIGSDLLVMDRVTLDEQWRGHDLGAVLAMEAVLRLMAGCRRSCARPVSRTSAATASGTRPSPPRLGAHRVPPLPGQRPSPLTHLAGTGGAA